MCYNRVHSNEKGKAMEFKDILIGIGLALLAILALFIVYVLIMTVSAYVIKPVEYTHNSAYYRFLLTISHVWVFFVARIKVEVEGREKIPKGTRYLFVSNHRSNFDPLVAWRVFSKENLAFISKEGNFHVPWFGRIIRKCCCLAIDRHDPEKALVTIKKAADLLKRDEVSVGIYPEGTRSTTGELLPFHNAVFKIAQMAKVPIVVTTIEGTENICKNYIRRRTTVYLKVVDVISAQEVCEAHGTAAIGARVREDMIASLAQYGEGDLGEISYPV